MSHLIGFIDTGLAEARIELMVLKIFGIYCGQRAVDGAEHFSIEAFNGNAYSRARKYRGSCSERKNYSTHVGR